MITWSSAFLSHSSQDKALVSAVARELGRRGIVAWLDQNELFSGDTLSRRFDEAIKQQTVLVAFLSPPAVRSPWVYDELALAFEIEQKTSPDNFVIPIFLDAPLPLVRSHDLLRSRLLHRDGEVINRLYLAPDPMSDTHQQAVTIAEQLAKTIYQRLRMSEKSEVVVYLDQRGGGTRTGIPTEIPPNLANDADLLGMVFRPNQEERSYEETLHGVEWQQFAKSLTKGLISAIGTPRWVTPKKIRTMGNAQAGLFYLLGRHFNRNTTGRLFCYNGNQPGLTNRSQPTDGMPLESGNENCETPYDGFMPLPKGQQAESISLYLGTENYLGPVINFREARYDRTPLYWVKSDRFTDSEQAMSYVKDVVALLRKLRAAHRIRTVYFYNTLPIHVIPLLAANLLHEVENVIYLEYRRDLQGKGARPNELYVPLEFNIDV